MKRGTGKSTAQALAALAEAIKFPGEWVEYGDNWTARERRRVWIGANTVYVLQHSVNNTTATISDYRMCSTDVEFVEVRKKSK